MIVTEQDIQYDKTLNLHQIFLGPEEENDKVKVIIKDVRNCLSKYANKSI